MSFINKKYTRLESCSGFPKVITITFLESGKVHITYEHKTLSSTIKFNITGKIVNESTNYILVKIMELDDKVITENICLDIFLFEKPNVTDDFTGLTSLNKSTSVLFNKFFNCALYINRNITVSGNKDIINKINLLDGVKSVSDDFSEKGGWSYEFERKASATKLV